MNIKEKAYPRYINRDICSKITSKEILGNVDHDYRLTWCSNAKYSKLVDVKQEFIVTLLSLLFSTCIQSTDSERIIHFRYESSGEETNIQPARVSHAQWDTMHYGTHAEQKRVVECFLLGLQPNQDKYVWKFAYFNSGVANLLRTSNVVFIAENGELHLADPEPFDNVTLVVTEEQVQWKDGSYTLQGLVSEHGLHDSRVKEVNVFAGNQRELIMLNCFNKTFATAVQLPIIIASLSFACAVELLERVAQINQQDSKTYFLTYYVQSSMADFAGGKTSFMRMKFTTEADETEWYRTLDGMCLSRDQLNEIRLPKSACTLRQFWVWNRVFETESGFNHKVRLCLEQAISYSLGKGLGATYNRTIHDSYRLLDPLSMLRNFASRRSWDSKHACVFRAGCIVDSLYGRHAVDAFMNAKPAE